MSGNNKAKTLRMEHVEGRKFTEKNKVEEIQLANLARASQAITLFYSERGFN